MPDGDEWADLLNALAAARTYGELVRNDPSLAPDMLRELDRASAIARQMRRQRLTPTFRRSTRNGS